MLSCTTRVNPKYCDQSTPCDLGACDLIKHECGAAPDMAAAADLAESPDMGPVADLAELPDLAEPDLIPPPDLEPPPDLTPPPVYFNPQVQAILNAGGSGGCAKSGCHNASDGLYTPFLIPNATTSAALHANFVSFSAEPQATVIQKLVKNDGIAHGGTLTSADRKPCASDSDEPCVTLSRWYASGSPEAAP